MLPVGLEKPKEETVNVEDDDNEDDDEDEDAAPDAVHGDWCETRAGHL
jgi:hypothetical protein